MRRNNENEKKRTGVVVNENEKKRAGVVVQEIRLNKEI